MSNFRRPILLVTNLLLIALGVGLFYLAKLCKDSEEPLRDRLDHPELLRGSMQRDEVQSVHDIVKGVRVGCTFAGVVVLAAGLLNLWLGLRKPRD